MVECTQSAAASAGSRIVNPLRQTNLCKFPCRGVASWTWFYPFHYAPMCSDMTNIAATNVHFAPGQPFLPFEQLLAVLPAASCRLLPQPFEVTGHLYMYIG